MSKREVAFTILKENEKYYFIDDLRGDKYEISHDEYFILVKSYNEMRDNVNAVFIKDKWGGKTIL